MSNTTKHRNNLIRLYGHLYRRHLDAGADSCFYCGMVRECLDHRPPVTALDVMCPADMRRARIPLVLVPCCSDCNRRLGDRPLFTAQEALAHVERSIDAEYQRKAVLWSAADIEEMSPMFQRTIKARQQGLRFLVERVRHAQERQLDDHLMPVYLPPDEDDGL